MYTVKSHEYDEQTGIDHYVLNPGSMAAQVKVIEEDGQPKVLLGVDAMAIQMTVSEPTWTVCRNKELVEFALLDYHERNK